MFASPDRKSSSHTGLPSRRIRVLPRMSAGNSPMNNSGPSEQARSLREQALQARYDTKKKAFDTDMYIKANTPTYTQGHGHGVSVVYGAKWPSGSPPTFSSAVELFQFEGPFAAYPSDTGTRWCIWIKWKSKDGYLSTDPAGTLGDALGASLGGDPIDVTARLRAMQLDASAYRASFLARWRDSRFGRRWSMRSSARCGASRRRLPIRPPPHPSASSLLQADASPQQAQSRSEQMSRPARPGVHCESSRRPRWA